MGAAPAHRGEYPGARPVPCSLPSRAMTRVLSGIQPTGETHLGNYLGAIRNWVRDQYVHESYHPIVDLHALTLPQDPAVLRAKTLDMAVMLLACGLDPEVCTLFVQSHVPAHTEGAWLMECTVSFGELRRMTQFKEKSEGQDSVSAGLLDYPVLMAADVLLYDTDEVPVGDDQRQHMELTRDVAIRFNHRFGETFVVPKATFPKIGARIMDLQTPTNKMSKSTISPQGTVLVLDRPEVIAKKLKSAVTDSGNEIRYDPDEKPGVSNLLDLYAVAAGVARDDAVGQFAGSGYGALKSTVADAVVEFLRPVRERYDELARDPGEVDRLLARGAGIAEGIATRVLERARAACGLLPRVVHPV